MKKGKEREREEKEKTCKESRKGMWFTTYSQPDNEDIYISQLFPYASPGP
jgi:hypothetical protein